MINIDIDKNLHGVKGDMLLDIDISINSGDFIALSGKSGSGKTTTLRILAGLESSGGKITVDDDIWLDKNIELPPQKRGIGYLFQDYAIFPNMSVEDNLLYISKDKELAHHLLDITNLYELKDRYPSSLSGGQQQRVSLCRAFMNRPKILLLDEPLSALDVDMRLSLQQQILSLHKEFSTTTIMISHDPSEIYRLANRVIVLDNGKIVDDGSPKDILLKTQSLSKLSFDAQILDIIQEDVFYLAIVSIGQQITEIVISQKDIDSYNIGDTLSLSINTFQPILFKK
jgi:molybdate transport system ATP-binding protein